MHEAIDYNALSWVRKELGETLRQARQELEAYADGNHSDELLQRCAAQLHQARGPLRMVSLKGADLLACEMEETIADLLLGSVPDRETVLEFLVQGFLELPEYLSSLRAGGQDKPMAMFPVINSLRAVRGLKPLREEAVFAPNLSSRVPHPVFNPHEWHDDQNLSARARNARVRFQTGLLEWYRGDAGNEGVQELVSALEELQAMACSEPVARLWWVGSAVAELLRDGGITSSPALKRLFSQLDRSIKRLMDHGESVFSDLLTDDLLRNLLFQVMQCDADSPRIQLVRQTYGLAGTTDADADGPDSELGEELLQTVSKSARADIERIKEQLDGFLTGRDSDPLVLRNVADRMHTLANLLDMLGMQRLGEEVGVQERFLRQAQADAPADGDTDLSGVANTLLAVEDALTDLSSLAGTTDAAATDDAAFRQGREAVIRAIMDDLGAAKESINEFLRSDADFGLLGNVPELLHKIRGGMVLAGEDRLAAATALVQQLVSRELLDGQRELDDNELDTMADAICSIEYCVEQLVVNRQYEDRAIEVAEDSLARLGYPSTYEPGADTGSATAASADDGGEDPLRSAEEFPATSTVEPDSAWTPDVDADVTDAEPWTLQVEPAAEPAAAAGLQVIDLHADPEIVAIFIEEADEVIGELALRVPEWSAQPDDAELLATVRRGFHTLKGSGRMVGAMATGEFAWAMEQLLNRLIEHAIPVTDAILTLIGRSVEALRQLLAQVSDADSLPDVDLDGLMQEALRLSATGAAAAELPSMATDTDVADAVAPDGPESAAVLPVLAEGADPEIVEIFLEEATEELLELRVSIAAWIAQTDDHALLESVRRCFHTLKGSGRMAGAMLLGELAWQVEVMLNKVLEGALEPTAPMCKFLVYMPDAMAELLQQVRDNTVPSQDLAVLMEQAARLASGQTQAAPAAEAAAAPEQAQAATEVAEQPDQELLELFAGECGEHLQVLATCVADAGDSAPVSPALFRALHTLTGISESAQVPGIGALAEPLYEYFGALHDENLPVPPAAFAVLDGCVQEMQRQHALLPQQSFDEGTLARLQERIQALPMPAADEATGGSATPDIAPDTEPALPEFVPDGAPVAESAVGDDAAEAPEPADALLVEPPLGDVAAVYPDASGSEDAYAGMDPELYQIFVEEAGEIMEAGEGVLRNWSAAPDDRELQAEFQRQLHTLKGGARMVNIAAVGDLSHGIESLLAHVTDGTLPATPELFALLNEAFDRLADMLDRVRTRQEVTPATGLERRLAAFMDGVTEPGADSDEPVTGTPAAGPEHGQEPVVDVPLADTGGTVVDGPVEAATDAAPAPAETEAESPATATDGSAELPRQPAAAPEFPGFAEMTARADELKARGHRTGKAQQGRGEQVRIQAEVLDSLVSNAGEISIFRSRMEQQVSNYRFNLGELDATISRLRDQLRKLEMETEAQILYRFEQESDLRNGDFDPLEMDRYSTLQQLSRSLIESISDLQSLQELMEHTTRDAETLLLQESRVNTDLQESLIRTRMIPFAGLAPRLRRIVRQTARELNKKVELELQGADGEMDRSVADRIIAPLEHMLRNAIAHGIEFPDQRERAGKPATGTIRIEFDRDGPEIVLRISDDGAGMNLPKIRETAVERGLMAADARLTDYEAMQFILMTGFSTVTEVTQISGRGVGMDVVNSEVKQLGGSLQIHSEPGNGTQFTVRLPYTLAINQALLVHAGNQPFFVPLASIEGVVRVYPEELIACYRTADQIFDYAGHQYRLKHLGTLLGTGSMDMQHARQQVPVLLLRIGHERFGVQVEELLGNREVVIKPLGAQFAGVEGVSGATILGDGRVVLILDMVAVSRMSGRPQPTEIAIRPQTDGRLMVMVVDDSITVRKVTSRLLERNGYQVLTAKDGVDAMGQLQETLPDMMLLDIEMPRMDGFELATHMRNDERLRHVPIIMITSRTGDKHRERAHSIGVNQYLGKPYQEAELLESIQNIIGVNTSVATG
jgi:chemosensory pili system protein ChpA (sensor histidine kinase/response regulator)